MKENAEQHEGGPILEGSPDFFIGGMPAARVGDKVNCNGPVDTVVEGEPSVLINNRPAARVGDQTAHGGVIVGGCGTVLIGKSRPERCAEQAADAASPYLVIEK